MPLHGGSNCCCCLCFFRHRDSVTAATAISTSTATAAPASMPAMAVLANLLLPRLLPIPLAGAITAAVGEPARSTVTIAWTCPAALVCRVAFSKLAAIDKPADAVPARMPGSSAFHT